MSSFLRLHRFEPEYLHHGGAELDNGGAPFQARRNEDGMFNESSIATEIRRRDVDDTELEEPITPADSALFVANWILSPRQSPSLPCGEGDLSAAETPHEQPSPASTYAVASEEYEGGLGPHPPHTVHAVDQLPSLVVERARAYRKWKLKGVASREKKARVSLVLACILHFVRKGLLKNPQLISRRFSVVGSAVMENIQKTLVILSKSYDMPGMDTLFTSTEGEKRTIYPAIEEFKPFFSVTRTRTGKARSFMLDVENLSVTPAFLTADQEEALRFLIKL